MSCRERRPAKRRIELGILDGKTALVTGGARGLGEAIATELAEQGATVLILDILDDLGEAVAAAIRSTGGAATYKSCDIRGIAAVKAVVDGFYADHARLDILVNNAAVSAAPSPISEVSEEQWTRIFDVNVTAAYRFCHFVMPRMKAQGGGVVINLSSVHQSHSFDGWTAYAATKGAIISMTRQLAAEWGKFNVRVNSVSPGAIDATMTREILDRDPTGKKEGEFNHMHALERLGRPIEVAKTVAFLASDGAGFITGEDILVDGGLTKVMRL